MRTVLFAGGAMAIVFVVANFAIHLLDQPSDVAVACGYALFVALAAAGVGCILWLLRRQS